MEYRPAPAAELVLNARVEQIEARLMDLGSRVDSLQSVWREDIASAASRQINLRVTGVVLLLLGILVTVAGNLMPV